MSGYGIPYTVHGWGDEQVTTVAVQDEAAPEGYLHVLRSTGPVILVPTVALTPVDTTPPEPEPGAWLIGDVIAVRFDDWRIPSHETSGPNGWSVYRFLWPTVWEKLGGPGITPRRLVPEPAPVDVVLPWRGSTNFGSNLMISAPDEDGDIEVSLDGAGGIIASANLAEDMAAALLAAARAAREATP